MATKKYLVIETKVRETTVDAVDEDDAWNKAALYHEFDVGFDDWDDLETEVVEWGGQ